MDGLREVEIALRARGERPDPLFVGLDFDGTLAPIVRRPESARIDPGTRRLLRRLSGCRALRLAVVSGRSLEDVRRKVALEGLRYAGNHGLEIEGDGKRWVHPAAIQTARAVQELAARLMEILKDYPGTQLEDKRFTVSVHYRRWRRSVRPLGLRRRLVRLVRPYSNFLRIMAGKKVWEIRPRLEWNKGHALLEMMRPGRDPSDILFAGDDATDAEAFRTLGPSAITVGIGNVGTCARFRLRSQRQVRPLLRLLWRLKGPSPGPR